MAIIEAKDNNHNVGDGMQQALEYAEILDIPAWELFEVIKKLKQNKLIKTISV